MNLLLYKIFYKLCVTNHALQITCYKSRVINHVLQITRYRSRVIDHVLQIMRYKSRDHVLQNMWYCAEPGCNTFETLLCYCGNQHYIENTFILNFFRQFYFWYIWKYSLFIMGEVLWLYSKNKKIIVYLINVFGRLKS